MRAALLALPLLLSCAVMSASAIDQRRDERLAAIRVQYADQHAAEMTPEVARAVREGRVLMGMTTREAFAAWTVYGPPYAVNRTTTADGVREQYVFVHRVGDVRRTHYLYIENGRVVATQD